MKIKDTTKRDVDICADKIKEILKEYRCFLDLDDDFKGEITIVDIDTQEFCFYR